MKKQPQRPRLKTYFKEWRKFRKMTLEAAAEEADMTAGNISAMERGAQGYSQEGLENLARTYRCDPGQLLEVDPFQNEAIWTVWGHAKPEDRSKIVDIARTIIGRGDKR